jgi:hypothetical protein
MYPIMFCLATRLLGIDVGWQPLPEGGMEYIIQIPPQALESLRDGEIVQSDIPASVKDIRTYRILVGRQPLPRKLAAAPEGLSGNPSLLPPDLPGKPIAEHKVTFAEQPVAAANPATEPAEEQPPHKEEPPRSWTLLTVVALLLFASLGGNLYLGWIVRDVHQRYRSLLEQKRSRVQNGPPA